MGHRKGEVGLQGGVDRQGEVSSPGADHPGH